MVGVATPSEEEMGSGITTRALRKPNRLTVTLNPFCGSHRAYRNILILVNDFIPSRIILRKMVQTKSWVSLFVGIVNKQAIL